MAEHQWVKHTITKVAALEDDEGQPVIFVDPEQQELAEEDAVYGCAICSLPMAGHFNTECTGESVDPED